MNKTRLESILLYIIMRFKKLKINVSYQIGLQSLSSPGHFTDSNSGIVIRVRFGIKIKDSKIFKNLVMK